MSGLDRRSRWVEIATRRVNLSNIDKEATNRHRRECLKAAFQIHSDRIASSRYPYLVMHEYLRQLIGPEVFEDMQRVLTKKVLSFEDRLDILTKVKKFTIDGKF